MTPTEEEYVHYAECCDSLNRSWRILQDLRATDQEATVRDAAFRFALAEYAKPCNRSDGLHRRKRDAYRLAPPGLLPEDLALHQQILGLRDQVLTHSDLTVKDAIVSLGRYEGRANICIAHNGPLPLPGIDAVIRLIERTLDIMYVEKARLLEALAPQA
jgi:hypothetical protein